MDETIIERVWREESEWLVARLHHKEHGTWLPSDECPTCQRNDEEDES